MRREGFYVKIFIRPNRFLSGRDCEGVHLATATGTPDSSGSNLRLAHICCMNAAFRLRARYNLVVVTRCTRLRGGPTFSENPIS